MTQVVLLVLALTAVCHGVLPETVDSGISQILEDRYFQTGQTEQDGVLVEVQQLPEDSQPDDGLHQSNISLSPQHDSAPPSEHFKTDPGTVTRDDTDPTLEEQESINVTMESRDLENSVEHGCRSAEDCGEQRSCLQDALRSKCQPCKAVDVPCIEDEECCGEHLCVWGQCSQNTTRGEAGTTCQHQRDCSSHLCCASHEALHFPVCLAKPIERERCFSAPNHLMELLSGGTPDEGPRRHCPCVGNLHCQHMGRGSMCLKEEDLSEEELTDSLYSQIDYII